MDVEIGWESGLDDEHSRLVAAGGGCTGWRVCSLLELSRGSGTRVRGWGSLRRVQCRKPELRANDVRGACGGRGGNRRWKLQIRSDLDLGGHQAADQSVRGLPAGPSRISP